MPLRPERYRNAIVPPFGHVWVLLTWRQDLAPEEMERWGKAFFDAR